MLSFNSICWRPILSYRGMMTAQILGFTSHECKASALPCIVLFILSPDFPSTECRDFTCWTQFHSVQSLIYVQLFVTPWTAAHQTSLPITNCWSLLKFMSIESLMLSNHLILCHLLLLPRSIFSSIRVFSKESVLHIRWPKYWSFSFTSVLPMNIQDWFPLGLTGCISLLSKGLSKVFSNTTVQKHHYHRR